MGDGGNGPALLDADADKGPVPPFFPGQGLIEFLFQQQHFFRDADIFPANGGGLQSFSGSAKQLGIQILFQRAEKHAQRRRCQMQLLRRPGDGPAAGEGADIGLLLQIHSRFLLKRSGSRRKPVFFFILYHIFAGGKMHGNAKLSPAFLSILFNLNSK